MGVVASRWRAKPSTVDVLEGIDKDIQHLEEFSVKNQRLLKLWLGRLLIYSSIFFLTACVVVYFWYIPEHWTRRLSLAASFSLFPILIWFIRKLLIFLFLKRTEKNNEKLEDLKSQRRKILDEVMETETYKNAKMILERFDPESKMKVLETTSVGSDMSPRQGQGLRHRSVTPKDAVVGTPVGATRPPPAPGAPSPVPAPGGPPEKKGTQPGTTRRPASPVPGWAAMHPPGPPLARPVLPRERGVMERMMEYLARDGPQNRYALVCQQCLSHNGMALKEEFEYLAFRCAYCYFLNPARKTRHKVPEPSSPSRTAPSPEDTAAAPASDAAVERRELPSPQSSPLASQDDREAAEVGRTPDAASDQQQEHSDVQCAPPQDRNTS